MDLNRFSAKNKFENLIVSISEKVLSNQTKTKRQELL